MQSVGTQIRDARLRAGMSLDEVGASTCISVKILQALEDDDLSPISSAFFYKSFVRQFAKQVGMPYENLAEAVAFAAATFPEQLLPGQGEAIIRSAIVRPARKPRNLRWLYPVSSFAVVVVACTGIYTMWQRSASITPNLIAPKVQRDVVTRRTTEQPSERKQPVLPITEADGRYHVRLSAVEPTWLAIKADGKMVYSGTLEVDQTKDIEGTEEGQVRTGNAGGVSIVFNGKPIGLAGPHGSVRTVLFTRDNYQVLPSPVHTALNLLHNPIAELSLPQQLLQPSRDSY